VKRRRRFTKAELRALGAAPGLMATRYLPGEDRARVEQLTAETPSGRPSLFLRPSSNNCSDTSKEGD
jgi:hypothetical protein